MKGQTKFGSKDPKDRVITRSNVPCLEGYRGPALEPGLGKGLDRALSEAGTWVHHPQEESKGSGATCIEWQTKGGGLVVVCLGRMERRWGRQIRAASAVM